jgi:hypothetical protein
MAFHEVRFPDTISRGARGGPERRTQIVELASGDEERNASWANSRRRYDVSLRHPPRRRSRGGGRLLRGAERPAPRLPVQGLERLQVRPAVQRRRRRSTSRSAPATGRPPPSSSSSATPPARRAGPAPSPSRWPGSVRVALGGVEQASGWSVDTTTGVVTFAAPPRRGRRRHRRLRVRRARPLRQRHARRDARHRAARLDHLHPARGAPAMNDNTSFVVAVLRELAASAA